MKIEQQVCHSVSQLKDWDLGFDPDLILVFVSPKMSMVEGIVEILSQKFEKAVIAGCSTSGEIMKTEVLDNSISLTAVHFAHSEVRLYEQGLDTMETSYQAGHDLISKIPVEGLRHVIIFSDGLNVNGANLVNGANDALKKDSVSITGGLAGDGSDFGSTFVISNSGVSDHKIIGIAFYGKHLQFGYGSKGGWDSFGVERHVTKSKDNVLYELDGKPALDLYKEFLGEDAVKLPSSALRFPLSLRTDENMPPLVRTILSIDEDEKSLTFAGNIPQNGYVRLMKANIDRLINGAENSAEIANNSPDTTSLSLLISCVGRRLVLKQLVEEEVEAVGAVVGKKSAITGFYSYGEIAPFSQFMECALHNQTMTITIISELDTEEIS